jgi:hypothetical protein
MTDVSKYQMAMMVSGLKERNLFNVTTVGWQIATTE